jgi:hypothetical protein
MAYIFGKNSTLVALGEGASAAFWSMRWFALTGIGAPTSEPRALTLYAAAPDSLTLAWSAPVCLSTSAPAYYDVQVIEDAAGGGASPVFPTLVPSVMLVGLKPATRYSVRVRATNVFGPSPFATLNVSTLRNDTSALQLSAPPPPQLASATDSTLALQMQPPNDLSPQLFNSFIVQMRDSKVSVATNDSWKVVCAGTIESNCDKQFLLMCPSLTSRLCCLREAMHPLAVSVGFRRASPSPFECAF